jgi:hypothetical protein
MNNGRRRAASCFAAGGVGALVNSICSWLTGALGITAAFGVALVPAFTRAWLYPRIVWGGLWGLLFLLPLPAASPWVRGAVLGLCPALAQLFYFFPFAGHKGVMGLQSGALTPLFVLVFDLIWGLTTALTLAWIDRADVPARAG